MSYVNRYAIYLPVTVNHGRVTCAPRVSRKALKVTWSTTYQRRPSALKLLTPTFARTLKHFIIICYGKLNNHYLVILFKKQSMISVVFLPSGVEFERPHRIDHQRIQRRKQLISVDNDVPKTL